MSKPQRLRNAAEGFMGGLVACGYVGPFNYRHLDWELPFYQAWSNWEPQRRTPGLFPRFEVGGITGSLSQGRDMLWQLKSTSPFHRFKSEPLPQQPAQMDVYDYLEMRAEGATPEEWTGLARDFLDRLTAD